MREGGKRGALSLIGCGGRRGGQPRVDMANVACMTSHVADSIKCRDAFLRVLPKQGDILQTVCLTSSSSRRVTESIVGIRQN